MTLNFVVQKNNCVADTLSRVPINETTAVMGKNDEIACLYSSAINIMPVTSQMVSQATRRDPILAKVMQHSQFGRPDQCPGEELRAYFAHVFEINIEQNKCELFCQ